MRMAKNGAYAVLSRISAVGCLAGASITRMINMGIEPFLICSSVLAIVAQRLIRRICTYCKESIEVSEATMASLDLASYFPKGTKKFEVS